MPQFRKRPVVVEAIQFTEESAAAHWFDGKESPFGLLISGSRNREIRKIYSATIRIPTLEGVMVASLGDWIIRNAHGEFYPCKPNIFEKEYEPAQLPSPIADRLAEALRKLDGLIHEGYGDGDLVDVILPALADYEKSKAGKGEKA